MNNQYGHFLCLHSYLVTIFHDKLGTSCPLLSSSRGLLPKVLLCSLSEFTVKSIHILDTPDLLIHYSLYSYDGETRNFGYYIYRNNCHIFTTKVQKKLYGFSPSHVVIPISLPSKTQRRRGPDCFREYPSLGPTDSS